ncbi:MAG: hypothetical protein ACRD4L_12985 [Pyrinomonadaceae bacterium]
MTGMNLHQFQELLPKFKRAFDKQEQKRKSVAVKTKVTRKRRMGGGSQFALAALPHNRFIEYDQITWAIKLDADKSTF